MRLTDPVPDDTSFVSATDGGSYRHGTVAWSLPTLAPGASTQVKLTVRIDSRLHKKVATIVNDGYQATSAEGP